MSRISPPHPYFGKTRDKERSPISPPGFMREIYFTTPRWPEGRTVTFFFKVSVLLLLLNSFSENSFALFARIPQDLLRPEYRSLYGLLQTVCALIFVFMGGYIYFHTRTYWMVIVLVCQASYNVYTGFNHVTPFGYDIAVSAPWACFMLFFDPLLRRVRIICRITGALLVLQSVAYMINYIAFRLSNPFTDSGDSIVSAIGGYSSTCALYLGFLVGTLQAFVLLRINFPAYGVNKHQQRIVPGNVA